MASPQTEDGFTKLANEILDHIMKSSLNGTQFRIVMAVWRNTYGFSRKEHGMSVDFLAEATKIHPVHVKRCLKVLIQRRILIVTQKAAGGRSRTMAFNKDYEQWLEVTDQLPTEGANQLPRNSSEPDAEGEPIDSQKGNQSVTNSGNQLAPQERKKKDLKKLPVTSKKYDEENTYFKMASYFYKKVSGVAEKEGITHLIIKADLQKWADEFRKLVERDKMTDKQLIREVMDWVTADSFWKTNVLSAKTFRDKFGMLALKSKAERSQRSGPTDREQEIAKEEAFREWVRAGNEPSEFVYNP